MECNRSLFCLSVSGVLLMCLTLILTTRKFVFHSYFSILNAISGHRCHWVEQFSLHFACRVKPHLCVRDLPCSSASAGARARVDFSGVVELFLRVSWVSRDPAITGRSEDAGALLRVLPGTAQSNNSTQKANQVDPHHNFTQLQTPKPFTP